MIDLTVNTVRSFHRTRVITPRDAGPAEMAIDVPEATQTRLDQTVKNWRLGQTLVISAGIHPGVLEQERRLVQPAYSRHLSDRHRSARLPRSRNRQPLANRRPRVDDPPRRSAANGRGPFAVTLRRRR